MTVTFDPEALTKCPICNSFISKFNRIYEPEYVQIRDYIEFVCGASYGRINKANYRPSFPNGYMEVYSVKQNWTKIDSCKNAEEVVIRMRAGKEGTSS